VTEELITGAGLTAAVGAKLLLDVCGPSAKYLGGEFASYTKTGVENLKQVFGKAARHIQKLKKTEGQVPPRVLKSVLSEGYFCEDELQASYLGGVLASSKGPVPRDDRALTYCSMLSSLSAYQIRTHYILYSSILRSAGDRLPEHMRWMSPRNDITVILGDQHYAKAMEFSDTEDAKLIAEHSFIGLENKGLSEGGMRVMNWSNIVDGTPNPFRVLYPTTPGIELFVWSLGRGDEGISAYQPALLDDAPLQLDCQVKLIHGKVSYA
jgi:hypothetical protein